MLKRLLVFTIIGGMFFASIQFVSIYFSVFEFDDFVKDELKYAPVRESDTKEHLAEHITKQARFYNLTIDEVRVHRKTDIESGITTLAVDLNYTATVDLYYVSPQIRRHLHASTTY